MLHIIPTYYPAKRYGGPIISVHKLCSSLVANGVEIDVVTTNVDGPTDSSVPTGLPVTLDGMRVWYFNSESRIFRRLYYSSSMSRHMNQRVKEYSLVHNHSVFLWPTKTAAKLSRKYLVKYIITPRGMIVKELFRMKSRLLKTIWMILVEKKNIRKAESIHFTSPIEEGEFNKFNIKINNSFILGNGVDGYLDEKSEISGDVITATKESQYFLFISRISWKKGLDRTLNLLAKNKDMRLVVAGNDDEELLPSLKQMASAKQLESQIIWIPRHVNSAEKILLFRRSLCLLLPSYSENFGNIVLESMYYGCPVIVTKEVGCSDIVNQSGGGYVVSNGYELDMLANKAIANERLMAEMGRVGSEYVRLNYSWKTIGEKMQGHYQSILAS